MQAENSWAVIGGPVMALAQKPTYETGSSEQREHQQSLGWRRDTAGERWRHFCRSEGVHCRNAEAELISDEGRDAQHYSTFRVLVRCPCCGGTLFWMERDWDPEFDIGVF